MSSAFRFALAGLVGVTLLAACGDDDAASSTELTSAAGESPATDAPSTDAPSTDAPSTGADDDPYGPAPTETTTTATEGETAPSGDASADADVATGESDLGPVLVNAEGLTLYAFMNDTEGEPTCVDDCAGTWPPALVDGEPNFGDLDASVFTVVEHPEGSQLKAGDWPLYTFASDTAPGDVNGQGVGDVWLAVAPDGSLIEG
ncbi:MAG: hypothetical protein H0V69_13920 [Acidimicrobiia bacterium]|nr:hypothetical protein [Acidimicrobiia bacterium]